jgi:hypothetical protein
LAAEMAANAVFFSALKCLGVPHESRALKPKEHSLQPGYADHFPFPSNGRLTPVLSVLLGRFTTLAVGRIGRAPDYKRHTAKGGPNVSTSNLDYGRHRCVHGRD